MQSIEHFSCPWTLFLFISLRSHLDYDCEAVITWAPAILFLLFRSIFFFLAIWNLINTSCRRLAKCHHSEWSEVFFNQSIKCNQSLFVTTDAILLLRTKFYDFFYFMEQNWKKKLIKYVHALASIGDGRVELGSKMSRGDFSFSTQADSWLFFGLFQWSSNPLNYNS